MKDLIKDMKFVMENMVTTASREAAEAKTKNVNTYCYKVFRMSSKSLVSRYMVSNLPIHCQ